MVSFPADEAVFTSGKSSYEVNVFQAVQTHGLLSIFSQAALIIKVLNVHCSGCHVYLM